MVGGWRVLVRVTAMKHGEKKQGNGTHTAAPPTELAPPEYGDPVIDAYKKDVDRTLLRENLKLTVEERFRKFERFMEYMAELHQAGQRSRK
jgi:hypothetical protein